MNVWVIGAGGLIGSAATRHADVTAFRAARIPWGLPEAIDVLAEELDRFLAAVGDGEWAIVWAAGTGVMRSTEEALADECALFESFCRRLGSLGLPAGGGFYLVSSAGGLYAGAAHPPFGVDTEPAPINDYGKSKRRQEAIAERALAGHLPLTIGRVANAYGPGQSLTKQQGLVTELCLCALLNKAATIFAPLDTVRDYIYVDEVAAMVVPDLVRMAHGVGPSVEKRILASGRGVTIIELIALVERSTGNTLGIRHTFTGDSHLLDLRLEAPADPLFEGLLHRSMEAGIALVFQDLYQRLGAGELANIV